MVGTITIGVIYGLSDDYATSIRVSNLMKAVKPAKLVELHIKRWPRGRVGKLFVLLKQCIRALDPRFRPDVIFASAPLLASALPAVLASRFKGIPLVADWDDAFQDFRVVRPRAWQAAFWERAAILSASHVTVVSETLETIAHTMGKSEVTYVPNGVDLKRFDPSRFQRTRRTIRQKYGLETGETVVGFVGSLNAIGQGFVGQEILACAKAHRDLLMRKRIRFLIVGWGEGLAPFKEAVRDARLENRFVFAGKIGHGKVPEIMSVMDVGIVPFDETAFTASTRSSCKIKEFMAMDIPVVTVAVGENRTDLEGVRGAVLVSRSAELCVGLRKVLERPPRKKELRSAAMKYRFADLGLRVRRAILGAI